jgi:hypothetical protein
MVTLWILFGDFNLIRCPKDKNNDAFHLVEASWFNTTINKLKFRW